MRKSPALRRLITFGAALTVAMAGFMAAVTPAQAGCRTVVIWSTDTGQYVSAELNDTAFPGMLRARAWKIGSWEKFTMCIDGFNYFTLKSNANGHYVAVEHDFSGKYQHMLRARTREGQLGAWERFLMEDWGDVVAFRSDRGFYVTAEYGGQYPPPDEKGMLRSRQGQTYRGPWESFNYAII